jgi:serine/threonine protein kinase
LGSGVTDSIETHGVIAKRYRLGGVLGRSLMSEVRRGEDLRLKRPVAIKLLRDDGDPRSIARFEREAQILARLHHPNIVVVFDTGVDARDRFIVMELIEGPTLRQQLDDEEGLGLERATEIARGIVSALGSAHDHGIVHRDVKPSNVLLPPDGGVKLVDMGIARLLSAEALTLTMSALGTARYMSPEQARGDPLDGRSDLYSLGCVLFEMLTGRTPFDGNPVALSYAHSYTPAPRVRSINGAVPAAMDDLVAAMLEKDPADRPQTADDVDRSLAAVASTAPTASTAPMVGAALPAPPASRPPPPGERRRPRASAWAPVVGALGGLLGLILFIALASARPDGRMSASAPPSDRSTSPTTRLSSPVHTGSPAPEQPSPQEAAALVLDAVGGGIQTGEITHDFAKEIDHTIDELLRETGKGEDVDKSLEKLDGLREKVSEAVEKGEITSAARASAIDEALLEFERALQEPEQ